MGRRHGRLADRQLPRRLDASGTTATATGCATSGCSDIDCARRRPARAGAASARFATRLAGSSNTFAPSAARSPRVNFVTAHDGFTLADLTAYDVKHNVGNGEQNRDGTDSNHSFNHGVEGPTDDAGILATRRKAMRNLLGTLLLSAGRPDAHGRRRVRPQPARQQQRLLPRQRAHLAELGARADWQQDLLNASPGAARSCAARTRRCARCASAGSARRCRAPADGLVRQPTARRCRTTTGTPPAHRTLQYLAASTPEHEEFNRILLIVHGLERRRGDAARRTRVSPATRCSGIPARGHAARRLARAPQPRPASCTCGTRCGCCGRTDRCTDADPPKGIPWPRTRRCRRRHPGHRGAGPAGIRFTPHLYAHDPAATNFGLEAAEKLELDPDRVFKTLLADADGQLVVGIVPVTGQLDLKALAAAVGAKKAVMADPKLAERKTGYVVGGISPIGQKTAHPTVIDETAELFDTVFVSGGRRGFDIELTPADLAAVTAGSFAAIGRQ